jgi:LysM repeat protein
MDTAPSAAGLAAAAAPDADAQQLAAFQAPDDSPRSSAGFAAPAVPEAVTDEPPLGASSMLAPPAPADDNRDFDPAPLPTFLATRSPRERTSFRERVAEESLTPVGEANVQGSGSGRRDGDRDGAFTRLLTMAAIVIILALGIATVIIVPGLLAGDPGQTGRPSLVAGASRQPTSFATSVAVGPTAPPDGASAFPTSEIPTPEATPTPTPRTYRVKAGDRLRQIAREFGVTVDQILAANPEIGDPNDIREGQRILIPTP